MALVELALSQPALLAMPFYLLAKSGRVAEVGAMCMYMYMLMCTYVYNCICIYV